MLLLLGGAVLRVAEKDAPTEPDIPALVEYVLLIGVLSALSMIRVPGL